MDHLWSPWRSPYVSQATRNVGCLFCEAGSAEAGRDRERLVLHRAGANFVLLNLYPYTAGHAMIAPYAHIANLEDAESETLAEMMELVQRVQRALKSAYKPEGYNLGMNLGQCAGAGVPDHLHLHIVPRWTGDTNFMTPVGNTRVLPEDIFATYDKLAAFFRS